MAPPQTDSNLPRGFWPALSVGLGLLLCIWRNPFFLVPNQHLFMLQHITHPDLYHGDPQLLSVIHLGYYIFSPKLIGTMIHSLGLGQDVMTILESLQLVLWGIQTYTVFYLARKLTGSSWAAVLASTLFAWHVPIFKIADAPISPSIAIGRSLGLTMVLPAVAFYFSGRKSIAWALGALSLYLHGIPGVHALELFIIADFFEIWKAKKGHGLWTPFFLRLASVAVIVSPILLSQVGLPKVPAPYASFGFIGMKAYPPINTYHPTDWILFFQGWVFLALAWSRFRKEVSAPLVLRVIWAAGAMFLVSVLSRLLYPMGLPMGEFLMKVSATFSYLFLVEIIGLILVSHWIIETWKRDPRWSFPLLIALVAFLGSHQNDYVLRFLAIALWGCALAGTRGLSPAWGISLGSLAAGGLWHWKATAIKAVWISILGFGGGLFSLPAFHWSTPLLFLCALSLAAAVRRARSHETLPLLLLMVVFTASASRSYAVARADKPLEETIDWIRGHTPVDSFILLPRRGGPNFYTFMIESERAAFNPHERYATMLYEHGPAALPMTKRLEDLGIDLACCKTDDELRRELDRAGDALDARRVDVLVEKYGVTHWLVREPWNPTPDQDILYRNGPYRLYGARERKRIF